MFLILVWLSGCGGGDSGGSGGKTDSPCDPEGYAEAPGMELDGGVPPWPCEDVCEDQDSEGRPFYDCYYTAEQRPICQYGTPCD